MTASRLFTLLGLGLVLASLALAGSGMFLAAMLLLGCVVIAGIGMAVIAWRSRN
ncbi:MAG: hypothetical protein ACPG4K_05975 [Haloferula sp.]